MEAFLNPSSHGKWHICEQKQKRSVFSLLFIFKWQRFQAATVQGSRSLVKSETHLYAVITSLWAHQESASRASGRKRKTQKKTFSGNGAIFESSKVSSSDPGSQLWSTQISVAAWWNVWLMSFAGRKISSTSATEVKWLTEQAIGHTHTDTVPIQLWAFTLQWEVADRRGCRTARTDETDNLPGSEVSGCDV